ncbi:hypothetical protein F0U60_31695 [Archangium minus]|uniref:DUF6310 domain-containing protein n=1 Tax=Archangium minus TaxID=83450 RepID=A0ABY9WYG8_9BACT|nr:hypothetical protein F0U60_31695 [Archangium minus]
MPWTDGGRCAVQEASEPWYNEFIQDQEIEKEMKQLLNERKAALACGYDFVVGVSTEAHKRALLSKAPTLNVVVTGCPR